MSTGGLEKRGSGLEKREGGKEISRQILLRV